MTPIHRDDNRIQWRPAGRSEAETLLKASEDPAAVALGYVATLEDVETAIRRAYAQGRQDKAIEIGAVLRGIVGGSA